MGTLEDLRRNLSSIQQREQVSRSNMVSGYRFDPPEQAAPYLPQVRAAEEKYGIPENLLSRLIHQESRWNPKAVSPAGARGIAQIMPKYHPDADPDDPVKAIDYAGKFLRQNYDSLGNDWRKAIAAYNAGPANVKKLGMDNLPAETRDYLKKVHDEGYYEEAQLDQPPVVAQKPGQRDAQRPNADPYAALRENLAGLRQNLRREPEPGYIETAAAGICLLYTSPSPRDS